MERARKLQREASDLRRKIGSNNSRAAAGAGSGGSLVRCRGKEGLPNGGAGAVSSGDGRDVLRKETSRLKRELHEQREACAVARAEGDKLQAALEVCGGFCVRVYRYCLFCLLS